MSTILSFQKHSAGSSLRPDANFALSRDAKKSGFLGIFLKTYMGADPTSLFVRLLFSAYSDQATAIALTRVRTSRKKKGAASSDDAEDELLEEGGGQSGTDDGQGKAITPKSWMKSRFDRHIGRYAVVRKVLGTDAHFEIKLPLATISEMAVTWQLFTKTLAPAEIIQSITPGQHIPASVVLQNARLPAHISAMFQTCLTGVEVHKQTIFAVFKATPAECEYMTNSEWVTIRAVDMHPLIAAWADASYIKRGYGKSALSITRIAQELPTVADEDRQVDTHGLCISSDGLPLYVPAVVDNTDKYEGMIASVGGNPDGSFSLASDDEADNQRKAKLPINIPVLTDWVNMKFAYTDSVGKIQVLPLEHVRKCTPAAALNIIRRDGGSFDGVLPLVTTLAAFAKKIGVATTLQNYLRDTDLVAEDPVTDAELRILKNLQDQDLALVYQAFISRLQNNPDLVRAVANYRDLTNDPNWPFYRPLHRFIRTVVPAMEENIERLNMDYAVTTVMHRLGMAKLLATYGGDMQGTTAVADSSKKAANEQGVDPNWTPPDAPLITKNFAEEGGLLPHQAKVRNLLKDSPDIAVLDVKAGGGKSLLSITDILYEIKASRGAPYLLMCPGHLVPNYVSEVVEFTDGGVNVIPITTHNIRTSGYERYEQILEAAPINTVLVVDYAALKYGAQAAVYGTATVTVFPVVEMIRKFKPGYAMMDESHTLKNLKSATSIAVRALVATIPKKRIATGTLSPDSPSDLPGQLALLDPTITGDAEEFNTRYAHPEIKYSGSGRVTRWRPNAGGMVMDTVKRNAVWCTAKRREWAAALPPRTDRFIKVELTERQRQCYDALFDDMVASLKAEAEKDAKARKLLEKLTGKKATAKDEDDFGDLGRGGEDEESEDDLHDDTNDIGAALQPHIAALERFVSNPADHPYALNGWVKRDEDTGKEERFPPLSGDDLRSPKAVELANRLREWLTTKSSKVIVFANQSASVKALWDQLPEDLRAQGLLYTAGDKVNLINKFRKDPKIKWLIGIRKSMEVGLNLQAAGYLIRVEGCWNPGEQEQGDSRIERPKFGGGGDQRDMLLFDTIVADRTIDITKAARLRAKILAVAKFENPTDEAYQAIPDIPVFSMTLDNIRLMNDFDSNIKQYQDSMAMLNQVIKEDYANYREQIKAQGGFKITNIKKAKAPAGCAVLSRVPYAPGTELYAAGELGLVRLDNYLGNEGQLDEDSEDGAEDGDEAVGRSNPLFLHQLELVRGMRCHTELGEGTIIGGGSGGKTPGLGKARIRLDDGSVVVNVATKVFVMTRAETNSIDMRNKLATAAGLPVTGEITVPAPVVKIRPLTKRERLDQEKKQREEERRNKKAKEKQRPTMSVSLQLSIVNGYMRLAYDGGDKKTIAALQSVGFKFDAPYVETRLRGHKHLINQAKAWADAGFNTTKEVDNDSLAMLAQELSTGALKTSRHYVRTAGSFGNYMRKTFKPQPDKKLLNIFGLITDGGLDDPKSVRKAEKEGTAPAYGIAYLCLPYGTAFPATRAAIHPRYKVPGTVWYVVENNVSVFVNSLEAAKKVIDDLGLLGVAVSNKDELNKAVKSVKKVAPKSDKTLDVIV